MQNKKGLSAVIITVIMIALAIVVVGIIWVVVQGLVNKGVDDIEFSSKCLDVELGVVSADCSGTNCEVVVKKTKGDEIAGVKVILSNSDGNSKATDKDNDIAVLATTPVSATKTDLSDIAKIEVTAYFDKEDGSQHVCTGVSTFSGTIKTTA